MAQFFTLLTEIGQAKLANAIALGQTIEITQLAVGDGGGSLPTPEGDEEQLINEVRRAAINTSHVDGDNPNWIVVEQVIPPDVGGWTIREVGIFDSAGDLIAYGNYPETYKPVLEEGSSRTQTVRFVLEVSDTAAVTLKVDPSVVLATRKYADDRLADHAASRDHPAATATEQGMVELATPAEVRAGDAIRAVTAFALKASGLLGGAVTIVTAANSPKTLAVAEAGLILIDATNGNVTLNLPAADNKGGLSYQIVRLDSSANTVTVARDGADTIDGAAALDLAAMDRRELVCDGASSWKRPEPIASETMRGMLELASEGQTESGASSSLATHPAGVVTTIKAATATIGAAGGDESDLGGSFQERLSTTFTAIGTKVFVVFKCHVDHQSSSANDFEAKVELIDVDAGTLVTESSAIATTPNGGPYSASAVLVTTFQHNALIPGKQYKFSIKLMKAQSNGPSYPRKLMLDGIQAR